MRSLQRNLVVGALAVSGLCLVASSGCVIKEAKDDADAGDSGGTGGASTGGNGGQSSTGGNASGGTSNTGGAGGATDGGVPVYSSYVESTAPTSVQFVEVCGGAMASNDLSADIALPFPIHFYDASYQTVRVSIHGWISFSQYLGSSSPTHTVSTLPDETFPNAAIYALWETLALRDSEGKIVTSNYLLPCYGTVGTAPNRTFVVEWKNAYFADMGAGNTIKDDLTFEIALNEADDTIDLVYKTISPDAAIQHADRLKNVTIGVENEAAVGAGHVGTKATQSTKVPTSGMAIRFTPVK